MTVYIFPVFVVAVSGTFMIFRKDILRYYHAIDAVLDDFDKMGVKFKLKFTEMYVMYVLLFVSVIVVFVWDMIRSGSKYTVFFWFVNYVPPLCAMAYVITILYYSICCDQIFKAINQFLSLYCSDDLSSLEKLALCKKNVKPEKLLDLVEGEPYTYYEKIFILHDEACDIIRRINNISGYEFLSFIGCAAVTLLSLVYDTCLDMVMISRGVPTMKRSFYATSYWPTVYACTLVNIVRLSSRVMGNANSTKYYLHKLRNIYPQLHDHVEVFSLQLVHQNMELSAARFFILDRTVIYKVKENISLLLSFALFAQLSVDFCTFLRLSAIKQYILRISWAFCNFFLNLFS